MKIIKSLRNTLNYYQTHAIGSKLIADIIKFFLASFFFGIFYYFYKDITFEEMVLSFPDFLKYIFQSSITIFTLIIIILVYIMITAIVRYFSKKPITVQDILNSYTMDTFYGDNIIFSWEWYINPFKNDFYIKNNSIQLLCSNCGRIITIYLKEDLQLEDSEEENKFLYKDNSRIFLQCKKCSYEVDTNFHVDFQNKLTPQKAFLDEIEEDIIARVRKDIMNKLKNRYS